MFHRACSPDHRFLPLACSIVLALGIGLVAGHQTRADDKPKESDPFATAHALLKQPPRPARGQLPPSSLPLTLIEGERIALFGNSTAERMNLFGHFESLLHQRFPGKHLVVRNFARPADEVGNRQRPSDYTKLDDPLTAFGADTIF